MTVIQVAFPVLRGKRRFHVEKGQRWSVVEHLMLDAVAREPASAADLSKRSHLPRRVVVEAFIRLMRVGWIEISADTDEPIFDVTPAGRAEAGRRELRSPVTLQPRWMSFVVDQVTGSVFRGRGEIAVRHRNSLTKGPGVDALVFLDRSPEHEREDLPELFAALEGENEIIVRVDPTDQRLVDRFGLVTFTDGVMEGLPGRAKPELRAAVQAKAMEAWRKIRGAEKAMPRADAVFAAAPQQGPKPALFDQSDLIIDGAAHEAALKHALRQARKSVIIHSTFLSTNAVQRMLPQFVDAASHGVKVHILWGQDEDKATVASSREAVTWLQGVVKEGGRDNHVVIHPFTTRSHAKLLVADDGQERWSAVVGSCNWLSSDFDSFEASVRLRDPALVSECLRHIAAMSLGPRGVWHDWAVDFTVLARAIERMPRGNGRTTPMKLLNSADHADLVLRARDEARRRIVVTSHRIGLAGRPMVVIPALAAAKAKRVGVELFYSRPTGVLSGVDAAGLAAQFAREGVNIKPIHNPRLHAKILAWDDDTLAVTSQNWLSADPAEGALRREIGVLIQSTKVADYFLRRFEHARQPV